MFCALSNRGKFAYLLVVWLFAYDKHEFATNIAPEVFSVCFGRQVTVGNLYIIGSLVTCMRKREFATNIIPKVFTVCLVP